jgi:cytochrome bd ubiquinol oxidase subunit I
MDDLLAARLQMAVSLGFHIIFASIGIAMPFFMAISHRDWLRHGRHEDYLLTKAWSKGVAMFFATGAVSGTVLSLELGLLWPEFMRHAGPIIGMPFSLEGAAFFLEAIALGLFLYGWDRLPARLHFWTGILVGISGVLSGLFVVCANGWMNSPEGFRWVNGAATEIDPLAAMLNRAAFWQGIHMTIAAFQATGFAVGGLHALLLLRRPTSKVHKKACQIALTCGAIAAVIQPITGDLLAKNMAKRQPEKLAAMELLYETTTYAPLLIGGWPVSTKLPDGTVVKQARWGIEIPGLLSFLAYADFAAEVKGLNEFPADERPPELIVHLAFQTMVGLGTLMALVGIYFLYLRWRRPELLFSRGLLRLLTLLIPAGFIALEAGWIVTEVGRQPWIIYRVMRTSEALTPMPGLWYTFTLFFLIYLLLTAVLVFLMRQQIKSLERSGA